MTCFLGQRGLISPVLHSVGGGGEAYVGFQDVVIARKRSSFCSGSYCLNGFIKTDIMPFQHGNWCFLSFLSYVCGKEIYFNVFYDLKMKS